MRILNISFINGPSYWSTHWQKLVLMRLDLQELEDMPTDTIEGFAQRLERLIPSLYEHRCSEGRPGGFLTRVRRGTWMGHVIEHIALELQTLAGMDCGFGRTRGTGKRGVYNVVFSCETEEAGLYAAQAATRIAHALTRGKFYDVETDVEELKQIYEQEETPPAIKALIREAGRKKIPYIYREKNAFVQLGYGKKQKMVFLEDGIHTNNDPLKSISGNMHIWRLPPDRSSAFYSDKARNLLYDLYPPRTDVSIPLVAVAGTQGKKLVSSLIGEMAKNNGLIAGVACNKKMYLHSPRVENVVELNGSAKALLKKKDIETAIITCPYDGIFYNGLPFSRCNIAVVTHVKPKNFPVPELEDKTYVAQAISAIVEIVETRKGYAVLNADDDFVYAMRYLTDADFALFSTRPNSRRIVRHAQNGGISAVLYPSAIEISKGEDTDMVIGLSRKFSHQMSENDLFASNILAAVLAAYLLGYNKNSIHTSMEKFLHSFTAPAKI